VFWLEIAQECRLGKTPSPDPIENVPCHKHPVENRGKKMAVNNCQ
jgi:hypothetical protein